MALNFPDSPTLNQVYTDTTSGFSYQWDGVVWQSYTPSATKNILVLDDISGSFNGSTTIFNLTNSGTAVTPANSQQLRVTLGGIVQEPGTDYLVAASTIIFTTAPTLGLDCSIVSLGPAVASDAPSSGTIFARQEYNPTGIQTTFTVTNSYAVGYLEVYHNGVKLVDGTDFTATDGSTFDLTTPAQNGDVVEAIVYLQTTLYTLGAYANDLTILGNATVAGITTLGGNVKVGVGTTALIVEGDARITGILTIGTSSVTIDGVNNEIKIGTGVTISSTGITGSASTVTSAATAYGLSGTPDITVGSVTATGNVSIAGTLTYEDVTNVDSVGLITARSGIDVTGGSVVVGSAVTITSGGVLAGVVTATSFVGDGSGLTSLDASNVSSGTLDIARLLIASQEQAEAGSDSSTLMTPQRVAQAISALAGGGSVVTTTFTSSGTFTKNADDLLYILHIISGGAGGGRRDGGGTVSAGGGGGGGLFTIVPASLISASTSVVVGSGGAAGGSNTNGGAGGNSSFGSFIVYGAAESSYLGRGSGLPGGISPPDAIYYGTSTYQLSPFSGSFEVGQNLTNAYVSTNPVFFTIFGAGAGMYREGTTWYNTHIRTSPFAGSGGTQASPDGTAPGGGGAAGGGASNVSAGAGARGEVRVYAIRA